jgi:hypothetical protein
MTFTIDLWSMMLAAGWLLVRTRLMGSTTKVLGAMPKLHCSSAPLQTWSGIEPPDGEILRLQARAVAGIVGFRRSAGKRSIARGTPISTCGSRRVGRGMPQERP